MSTAFIISLAVFILMTIGFVLSNAYPELFIGGKKGLPATYTVTFSVYGTISNQTTYMYRNQSGVVDTAKEQYEISYGYMLVATITVDTDLSYRVAYHIESPYVAPAKGRPPDWQINRVRDAVAGLDGKTVTGHMKKDMFVPAAYSAFIKNTVPNSTMSEVSYSGSEMAAGIAVDKIHMARKEELSPTTRVIRSPYGGVIGHTTLKGVLSYRGHLNIYVPLKMVVGYSHRISMNISAEIHNDVTGETRTKESGLVFKESAVLIKHSLPLTMKRAEHVEGKSCVVLAGLYFSDPRAYTRGEDIYVENHGDDPASILVVDSGRKIAKTGAAGPHGSARITGVAKVLGDNILVARTGAGYGDPYVAVRVFFTVGMMASGVIAALTGYLAMLEREAEESYEEELLEKKRKYRAEST